MWSAGTAKSLIQQILVFPFLFSLLLVLLLLLLTITSSGHLPRIRWTLCISKYQRILCVSFSRTGTGLLFGGMVKFQFLSLFPLPSFTPLEFFTSVLADGFSLESEWQQVSSGLQNSSQDSGRSQIVSTRPPNSKSSWPFNNPLVTVPYYYYYYYSLIIFLNNNNNNNTHMHTHTHVDTYIDIYVIYIYTYIYIYMYIYKYVCVCVCVWCIYIYIYVFCLKISWAKWNFKQWSLTVHNLYILGFRPALP